MWAVAKNLLLIAGPLPSMSRTNKPTNLKADNSEVTLKELETGESLIRAISSKPSFWVNVGPDLRVYIKVTSF